MTTHYSFLARWLYGSNAAEQAQISIDDRNNYARAILTIAAADGLSAAEREYFVSMARGLGMPDDIAESYAHYDAKSSTLADLLRPLQGRHPVPSLIYDAIRVASVDGYSEVERKKVEQAAVMLGMPVEMLRTLESLVVAEEAVRQARLSLFASFAGK